MKYFLFFLKTTSLLLLISITTLVLSEEAISDVENDFDDDDDEINNLAVSIFGGFIFFIGMVTMLSLVYVYYKIDFNRSMSQMIMTNIGKHPLSSVPTTTQFPTSLRMNLDRTSPVSKTNNESGSLNDKPKKSKLKFEYR